jgi:hypothetical protein
MSKPRLVAILALGSGLAGPVLADPQISQPVYAVVGGQLLAGISNPNPLDDTGVVVLKGQGLSCGVQYRYLNGGKAHFACSDGSKFVVTYQGFSTGSGSGQGAVAGQPVSLCYGLPAKAAARHLVAPRGYALVVEQGRLALKPAGA